MDTPEKIWHLIAKSLNNEASAREQEELTAILHQDESLQQQYDLLTRIWNEKKENIQDEDSIAARHTISRIINRAELEGRYYIEPSSSRKNILNNRIVWLAAASAIAVIFAIGFWINNRSSSKKQQEAIVAGKGSRSRSLLPDGTTVWLNVSSRLYYENDFSGATREVRLEGEAFFDVVKQSNRPFIVHTSGIDIKVLGTAFNVKSYPEDKTVETTLYRGQVKVFRHDDSAKTVVELRPNEKLVLSKQAAIETINLSEQNNQPLQASAGLTITYIDSTKKENERIETAWLFGRLEFRGDSFEDLAKKLERWYNVTIVFTDEKVKQLTVNGSFEGETVEQAFAALKEGFPVNYKINNHEIFVGSFR